MYSLYVLLLLLYSLCFGSGTSEAGALVVFARALCLRDAACPIPPTHPVQMEATGESRGLVPDRALSELLLPSCNWS